MEVVEIYTDPECGSIDAVICPRESSRMTVLAAQLMGEHLAAVRRGDSMTGFGCPVAFLSAPASRLAAGSVGELKKNLPAPVRLGVMSVEEEGR